MKSYSAKIDITPLVPVPLAGRVNRDQVYKLIADELEANLLAFRSENGIVVLVALDVLFASSDFKSHVVAAVDHTLRPLIADIIFIASHTHNAPALDATKPMLGKVDEGYFRFVVERIATAVEDILRKPNRLSPTQVLVGKSQCALATIRRTYGIRISRRRPFVTRQINLRPNLKAELSRDVDVAIGQDSQGQITWVMWSWTCHATATYWNKEITADFPGYVRNELREGLNLTDVPILYFPGFCGDVRSDQRTSQTDFTSRLSTPFIRPFAAPNKGSYESFCEELALSVRAAIKGALPTQLSDLPTTKRSAIALHEIMKTKSDGELEAYLLDWGGLSFFFLSAEVCSPYLRKLNAIAKSQTWFSGYINHVQCYLPDDTQIAEGGYEVTGFFESFGHSGPFHQKVEDKVMSMARKLLSAETSMT
jgi:hypothetical protein